jgi:sentrin-specific protease 1
LEEVAEVNAVMQDPDDEKLVFTIGTNRVTVGSLKTLRPATWVNDEVINGYLRLLDRRHKENSSGSGISHVYLSFFMTQLTERWDKDMRVSDTFDYNLVQKWSRKVPGGDIFKLDKLFFPINRRREHWLLIVAFMQEGCIRLYDSMDRHDIQMYESYTKKVFEYLRKEKMKKHAEALDKDDVTIEYCAVPQQTNGNDCGVFVCGFVEHILNNRELKFSQTDIDKARTHIAHTLIREGIEDGTKPSAAR